MTENLAKEEQTSPEHFRDGWPFFWINRANAYYTQALEKRLKPLGVDAPKWRVLMSLHEQNYMSVSEIAEFSTLKLNTTTKIVQRMIADGLVETRVRASDARVTEVCLTAIGDDLRAKALVEVDRIKAEAFYNTSPAELDALNDTLRKISDDLFKLF